MIAIYKKCMGCGCEIDQCRKRCWDCARRWNAAMSVARNQRIRDERKKARATLVDRNSGFAMTGELE